VNALLVDNDWTLLQHCLARIGGRQHLTLATSKAQANALLRHGSGYDAAVVCERLEDGSGLALLDDIQAEWPQLIRVFCAERQRLALVRSRLSALRVQHVLAYPINPTILEVLLLRLARIKGAAVQRTRPPRRPPR
jgi:DNA-binding NtrC family response regulator